MGFVLFIRWQICVNLDPNPNPVKPTAGLSWSACLLCCPWSVVMVGQCVMTSEHLLSLSTFKYIHRTQQSKGILPINEVREQQKLAESRLSRQHGLEMRCKQGKKIESVLMLKDCLVKSFPLVTLQGATKFSGVEST